MKKLIIILMSLIIAVSLAACGDKESEKGTSGTSVATTVTDVIETDATTASETAASATDATVGTVTGTTSVPDTTAVTASPSPETTAATTATAKADIGSLIPDNGEYIIAELDESAKQEIVRLANAEGFDIYFNADKSTVISDGEGNKYKQNADGSWEYEAANAQSDSGN